MYTARLSLFCATALLVSGAYASDSTVKDEAPSLTDHFSVQTTLLGDSADGSSLERFAELRRDAARASRQDGRWLRISNDETDTAVRQPQPFNDTPRWVF